MSLLSLLWIRDFCDSYGIAAVVPFSHRLAYDDIPPHIQRLRCKVNFQALRFVPTIIKVGSAIIDRLRSTEAFGHESADYKDSMENKDLDLKMGIDEKSDGKFLALHLRFDKVDHNPLWNEYITA